MQGRGSRLFPTLCLMFCSDLPNHRGIRCYREKSWIDGCLWAWGRGSIETHQRLAPPPHPSKNGHHWLKHFLSCLFVLLKRWRKSLNKSTSSRRRSDSENKSKQIFHLNPHTFLSPLALFRYTFSSLFASYSRHICGNYSRHLSPYAYKVGRRPWAVRGTERKARA